MANSRRKPGVRGRTDLGVSANETGAYAVKNKDGADRVVYRLRAITDGFLRDFVDDGSSNGTPLNGRQALIAALKKTQSTWDGDTEIPHPVFFLDKRVNAQFARVNGIPIPVADKEVHAVMAENVEARTRRSEGQRRDFELQKQEAAAEQMRVEDAARKSMGK